MESYPFSRRIHLALENVYRSGWYDHSGSAVHGDRAESFDFVYETAFHTEDELQMLMAVRIVEYGLRRGPFGDGREPAEPDFLAVYHPAYVLVCPHGRTLYTIAVQKCAMKIDSVLGVKNNPVEDFTLCSGLNCAILAPS